MTLWRESTVKNPPFVDYSSLMNLQHLNQEEDEGLTVDRITIPEARISNLNLNTVSSIGSL